jgi:hypothetical protein
MHVACCGRLPAIAAVVATATAAATTTATAAATAAAATAAAATPAAAATEATAAATAAAALTRLVDVQLTAVERRSVHVFNRALRGFRGLELHEAEAARLPRHAIENDGCAGDAAKLREGFSKLVVHGVE